MDVLTYLPAVVTSGVRPEGSLEISPKERR